MENRMSFGDKIDNYLSEYRNWILWRTIIFGQILSVCLCILAFITHHLCTNDELHIPTGLNYLHYLMLCAVFTTLLACRKGDKGLISVFKARGVRYILIGLIDVQSKTLLAALHQYTTLTSIQLLDCVALPVTLALGCLTLGVRFRFVHILGVLISLMGIGCIVWSDVGNMSQIKSHSQLVGDMLCLGGAVLFAVVAVLQELVVKTLDCIEYLGMLGLCGSLICGLQMFLLEQHTLTVVNWENKTNLWYLLVFSLVQFVFYSMLPYVLKRSGSTALQLYLLTADFYTLIFGMVFWHYKINLEFTLEELDAYQNVKTATPGTRKLHAILTSIFQFHAFFFLSFVLTMCGIYVFAIKRTQIFPQQQSSLTAASTASAPPQFTENPISNYYLNSQQRNNSSSIIREYMTPCTPEGLEMSTSLVPTVNSRHILSSEVMTYNSDTSTNTAFSTFYAS